MKKPGFLDILLCSFKDITGTLFSSKVRFIEFTNLITFQPFRSCCSHPLVFLKQGMTGEGSKLSKISLVEFSSSTGKERGDNMIHCRKTIGYIVSESECTMGLCMFSISPRVEESKNTAGSPNIMKLVKIQLILSVVSGTIVLYMTCFTCH